MAGSYTPSEPPQFVRSASPWPSRSLAGLRLPLRQEVTHRVPLGSLDDLGTLPRYRFYVFADRFVDAGAQDRRRHRIELPAPRAVALDEPAIAGVAALLLDVECGPL